MSRRSFHVFFCIYIHNKTGLSPLKYFTKSFCHSKVKKDRGAVEAVDPQAFHLHVVAHLCIYLFDLDLLSLYCTPD